MAVTFGERGLDQTHALAAGQAASSSGAAPVRFTRRISASACAPAVRSSASAIRTLCQSAFGGKAPGAAGWIMSL
ncbi:MAG: hypothetical protein ACREQN_10160 [Candidatus Binataceae bacterium]